MNRGINRFWAARYIISLSIMMQLFIYLPQKATADVNADIMVVMGSNDYVNKRTQELFKRFENVALVKASKFSEIDINDIQGIIIDGTFADSWQSPKFDRFINSHLIRRKLLSFVNGGGYLVVTMSYNASEVYWDPKHEHFRYEHLWTEGFPYNFSLSVGKYGQRIRWGPNNPLSVAIEEKLINVPYAGSYALRFKEIGKEWNVLGTDSDGAPVALECNFGKGGVLLFLEHLWWRPEERKKYFPKIMAYLTITIDYALGRFKGLSEHSSNDVIYLKDGKEIFCSILEMDQKEITIKTREGRRKILRESVSKIIFSK